MSKTDPTTDANGATRSYLGADAADLQAAGADGHAAPTADRGPLAPADRPTELTNGDGTPAPALPGGHVSDSTSSGTAGSAG